MDGTFDPQVASSAGGPAGGGSVTFAAGRVRYAGPCYDADGPATIVGSAVTFGPMTATVARACTAEEQRTAAAVSEALVGVVAVKIAARNLTLTASDGSGVLLIAP